MIGGRGAESEPLAEPEKRGSGATSAAQAPAARPPVRASRRAPLKPPQTLVELYTNPKAKAADLLKFLSQRDLFVTPEEDQAAALGLVGERDPEFVKTKSLAVEVANTYDGRFTAAFDRFLSQTVESEFGDVADWPPNSDVPASQSFYHLLDRHRSELARKEPRRRVFNALMIAQAVLSSRYHLQIHDVVPALKDRLAIGRPGRKVPTALGHPAMTVQLLRLWLEALSPWMEVAATDSKRADRAEHAERELTRQLQESESRVAQLEEEYAAASRQLVELREELRSVKLARQLENSQLRGSLAGFLLDEVQPCLLSVREGLGLEPPRLPYVLQRLDDADHAIEGKVKWLRSSV